MADSSDQQAGWLDVHCHFSLPQTDEEAREALKLFHQAKFMTPEPFHWSAEQCLQYDDKANVRMQMLSYIPQNLENLKRANDFGASVVEKHPNRFGLLAALPTDSPTACLEEIERTDKYSIPPDGFATSTVYNGVYLSERALDPVWEVLNTRKAVVHIHPNAVASPPLSKPLPLIEVAFDTTRTAVEMLYNGVFRRYPDIHFILAHCGGGLPVLSGRLQLLGTEVWVPNPHNITRHEIETQLARLYVDTAATAKTGLAPAAQMVGVQHCVYGADCGVPCSTELTMEENRKDVMTFEQKNQVAPNTIGHNGWALFPAAAQRAFPAAEAPSS